MSKKNKTEDVVERVVDEEIIEEKSAVKSTGIKLTINDFTEDNNKPNDINNAFKVWYTVMEKKSILDRKTKEEWNEEMVNFLGRPV